MKNMADPVYHVIHTNNLKVKVDGKGFKDKINVAFMYEAINIHSIPKFS